MITKTKGKAFIDAINKWKSVLEKEQIQYLGLENIFEHLTSPLIYVSNHQNIQLDSAVIAKGVLEELENLDLINLVPIPIRGANLDNNGYDDYMQNISISFDRNNRRSYIEMARNVRTQLELCENSVWISQSPGRAKNGKFETDCAIANLIKSFNAKIVPVRISYEFEPTVGLMAAQQLYGKNDKDDKLHMQLGLSGNKGLIKVIYGKPFQSQDKEKIKTKIDEHMYDIDKSEMARFANGESLNSISEYDCKKHLCEQLSSVNQRYSHLRNSEQVLEKILEFYKNAY